MPITVVGGNSRMDCGWQISPDRGATLSVTGLNSTGLPTFENASDLLAPPLDTGVDHISDHIGVAPTTVKYSGSQLGAASDWGGDNWGDDSLVWADPSTASDSSSYADLTLQQSPEGIVVNSPLAVWQSLAGLLAVMVLTLRPSKDAKARA
jgi:hypothetical protein